VLYKEIPFLRLGVPLCTGIITGLFLCPGTIFFIVSASVIALLFVASRFFNKFLTNTVYGVSITLGLWLAGLLLYTFEKETISDLDPRETIFKVILDDTPEEKEKTWKMIVRLNGIIDHDSLVPAGGSLLIYHRKHGDISGLLPGDELIMKCKPVRISNRGNPGEFDYRFFMENQGIRYYAFTDSSDIIRHKAAEHRKIRHSALIIRDRICGMYTRRGISEENLGLVVAMTLGQKNLLDPDQKEYFIKAGVMHIMAVSGLHTVILSLFIFNMLFFLKGNLNILRVIITLVILWGFAFITGLTPSVMRATLMFSFLQTGKLMKRPVNGINSVLASAFILILIRPSVIFDAGFLLSYSAVLFIICFYRDLYLKLRIKHRIPDLIWQSAAVTIIAQAGTLPLTIMLFNRFPVWFILTNIIIVPLSSLVVITGVLVLITFPLPFLSHLLAWILEFLTSLTEKLTEKAALLPLSTIENIGLTTIECILLTITIFLFCYFLLNRKSISVFRPLTSLLMFVTAGTIQDLPGKNARELIVYNTAGNTAVGIRSGKVLYIYTDTPEPLKEVSRHISIYKLREERSILNKNTCINAGNNKILVTDCLTVMLIKKASPDIIILTGPKAYMANNIKMEGRLKALIIGTDVKYQQWFIPPPADTIHFVRSQGAFYRSL